VPGTRAAAVLAGTGRPQRSSEYDASAALVCPGMSISGTMVM